MKADQMVEMTLRELEGFKRQADERAATCVEHERNNFQKVYNELLESQRSPNQHINYVERGMDVKEGDGIRDILLDHKMWENAGYSYSDQLITSFPSQLLELIQQLPLKQYNLKNDSKRDIFVSKASSRDEMRTRTHIGLIDSDFVAKFIDSSFYRDGGLDPNLLYFLNLKALGSIADEIDGMRAQLEALKLSTEDTSSLSLSINHIRDAINSTEEFASISDLAVHATVVEAELTRKNIALLLYNIKHALRLRREDVRIDKVRTIMEAGAKSDHLENIASIQQQSRLRNETIVSNDELSSLLLVINFVNEIFITANKTER
jgi:hypothetical protein